MNIFKLIISAIIGSGAGMFFYWFSKSEPPKNEK